MMETEARYGSPCIPGTTDLSNCDLVGFAAHSGDSVCLTLGNAIYLVLDPIGFPFSYQSIRGSTNLNSTNVGVLVEKGNSCRVSG